MMKIIVLERDDGCWWSEWEVDPKHAEYLKGMVRDDSNDADPVPQDTPAQVLAWMLWMEWASEENWKQEQAEKRMQDHA